jgi:UMF1 family MFS transporter
VGTDETSRYPAPALAWALYDFAYSAFSFLIVVRFLPTWIIDDLGRSDWFVSATQVLVVLVVLVLMPLLGAVSDQRGHRKELVVVFTCCAAVAAVGLSFVPVDDTVLPALVVAGVVIVFAQLAFAQYDPLLVDVAEPRQYGRVSGLAVALGFAGTIAGLAIVAEAIVGDGDKQRAFAPAAALYVLFALPLVLLVRERNRPHAVEAGVVRRAFVQVGRSVRQTREYPRVFRFLAGRLFYSEAIATLSAFLPVYMTRLGGFSERDKNIVLGISVLAAACGAIAGGRFVGRVGPRAPLLAVLPVFAAFVALSGLVGQGWTVWVVSPIAGVALGVVWTADRVFMLHLTPAELRGQFFGLFNLANRVASAIGPLLIWGLTIWVLHERTGWLSKLDASRVVVVLLAGAAVLGWLVISRIEPDTVERAPPQLDAAGEARPV